MPAFASLKFEKGGVQILLLISIFLLLPFALKVLNVIIILLFLFSVWNFVRTRHVGIDRINWFLPSLFLFYALSIVISGGGFPAIEKRLLFLLIPLIFCAHQFLHSTYWRMRYYVAFIAGNLTAFLVCVIIAVRHSIHLVDGHLIFNPKVQPNSDFDFFTSAVMGGNYFFADDFSYFLHPTYFSMYLVFSQFLCIKLIDGFPHRRTLLIGLCLFLFVPVFMLSSKAGILASALMMVYLLFSRVASWRVRIACGVAIAGVCLLLALNPKFSVFIKTFKTGLSINPQAQFGHDLRILSWDASLKIIRQHWLWGVGEGKKDDALVAMYNQLGYLFPAQERHNSHNQYLDFMLTGGVVLLILFLFGCARQMFRAIKNRNEVLAILLLLVLFNLFFENILSRYAGVAFFSLFWTLLTTDTAVTPPTRIFDSSRK